MLRVKTEETAVLAKIVKVEEHRQTDVRKREIDKSEKSKDFLDNKEKDKKLAPYNRTS